MCMQTVHGISKKQGFFVVIQERQQIHTFYYNSFYCDVKERDFLKISLMWLIKICSAEKVCCEHPSSRIFMWALAEEGHAVLR